MMRDEFLDHLMTKVQSDARIRAGWLEGSLGRGNADRFSDIDLHLLVREDGLQAFKENSEAWLAEIRPLVLFSLMFDGRMINAMTVDGLRVDVWLHPEENFAIDPTKAKVTYDPEGSLRHEASEPYNDTASLLPRIREFWRCIALTPAVIGRHEQIVSFQGLSIETMLLIDILMSGYGIVRDRGVKNLNGFLPAEIRQEIEQAISMQGLSLAGLARAQLAMAAIIQSHGRTIAERHHFDYPEDLERAVLTYVHSELALLGIEVEPSPHAN